MKERSDEMEVGVHPLVRHLDLFSGIGGFALAARMVGGIETVAFCEIDPWAQKVLAKNFPGVPICDDVKTIKGENYGTIGLVTGGYPCQPFSSLGKRRGEKDHRHLWPEMFRIIKETRPRWVLSENVVAHVAMGLDEVLVDLESIGYSCGATVLPACALDARHRRDRVWIVAGDTNSFNVDSLRGVFSTDAGSSGEGWRLPAPGMDRGANGLPGAMDRNRGLGNAIVPQVAAEILCCMMRVDSVANGQADRAR